MYRGYYRINVMLLVGQGGHTKVCYGPFGLGLGQGHGEMICAPLYYIYMYTKLTISVHYIHNNIRH